MAKRIVFLVTVFVLVFSLTMSIGCTLAWIHTSTNEVVNTFEYGDVNITLTETPYNWDNDDEDSNDNTNKYLMVPGNTIAKNPTVTVKGANNAVACWLFIKVEKTNNPDAYLAYKIDPSWNELDGFDGIYYRAVSASSGDQTFGILVAGTHTVNSVDYSWANDQVLVKPEVTKAQLNALGSNYPTLTFTAYAVQSANLTDSNSNGTTADEAWAIANP